MSERRASRKQQILEAFAAMLHAQPGGRITTAALAKQVGVSEAALYRHFPSKARMFEGLIEFIEESVFSRVPRIAAGQSPDGAHRCGQLLGLLLAFAQRNPGITRLLTGDALSGETPRLRTRIRQVHDRLETQLRQWLRESESRGQIRLLVPLPAAVDLMMALVEGKLGGFVRSEFRRLPTEHWDAQWHALATALFQGVAVQGDAVQSDADHPDAVQTIEPQGGAALAEPLTGGLAPSPAE